jgi:UDP-N-acetyl-2-amino-2-deoxyglucuronate dehydrogenase
MKPNERTTIALVGCGRISRKHIETISALPELELVGVCDVRRDRAERAAAATGAPAFTDHAEMANALRPDIVSILTESGSHVSVACDVVPHARHVIVEKPIALTLDSADRLIEACEHAGVGLYVVKQNRYNPPVVRMRSALAEGRFGKLVLGTVRVRWCRDQGYYDQDPWRGTWAQDGGVFTNQASHHIDLLQWMLGPVESVQAYTATRLVKIETEDTGIAIFKFTSGALGIVEATTATRPKDLEGSLSLLGERGTAVISGFAVNRVETWNFSEPTPEDAGVFDASVNPPNVYGFGHLEFYRDVLRCIRERKRPMLDGMEGRKSLELITAMYEAAFTHREVRLRYIPHDVPLGRG